MLHCVTNYTQNDVQVEICFGASGDYSAELGFFRLVEPKLELPRQNQHLPKHEHSSI